MSGGIRGRLTDRAVRNWIGQARAGKANKTKLSDGGGLRIQLTRKGTPVWRIKYRFNGDEGQYSVGMYPEIGLEEARDERDRVRAWLREGRDPMQAREVEKGKNTAAAADTFGAVTEAWLEAERKRKKWSAIHYRKSRRALERDVLPLLGRLPIADIEPVVITTMVKAILARGVRETAARVLQHVTGVFTYAQAHGMRADNPAQPAQKVLPRASAPVGRPALLKFPELGEVLRRAEAEHLSPAVRLAQRLCAFAPGARIGNIVTAAWRDFQLDGDAPVWVIPRKQMKAQGRTHDHKVFLGPVIAEELRAWRGTIGAKGHLFPGATGGKQKHISREALEKVYRVTLGLADRHSPHGWRAAFSTLAREEGGFDRDVVELALDHVHDTEVVRAYDRGSRLEQRVRLATWWSEQLAQAQRGADVTPIRKKAMGTA